MLSLKPGLLHALTAGAVAGALALAGCGGGGDDEAASPLDEALGHLPEDAGFALIASTDLDDYDDARKLVEKFPFGGRIQDGLEQGLEQEGVNFEDDIRPLLGNELVIGTADNASFTDESADTPFVMAAEAADEDKLRDLVEKDGSDNGSSEGYDLYTGQDDDTFIAIKDDVFVLSDDEETLKQALKQRGEDDRLTEEDVDTAFEGLPEDAPIRGYANLAALLAADPDAKEALKVKWVEHLETLAFTANAGEDGISLDYFARTDPEGLSDGDLPLAAGAEAPRLLEREGGSSEVVVSLRDPSQVAEFAMATGRVLDPGGYAQFEAGKERIGQRLGIDVEKDVLAQLTGNLAAVVRIDGKFGVRAELEDARAFDRTLAKVMKELPEFSDDITVTPPAGGLYRVTTDDGKRYWIGGVTDSLVVANDSDLAYEIGGRALVEAEGQEGALVSAADAERLANEALARFAGGLEGLGGSLFTGPLGDLTSSAEASTDGIHGSLSLEIE